MTIDADTAAEIARNLRKWADVLTVPCGDFVNLDCRAAADALEAQAKEIAELIEALKPFGRLAEYISKEHPGWNHDEFKFFVGGDLENVAPIMADFRRTRAVLEKLGVKL